MVALASKAGHGDGSPQADDPMLVLNCALLNQCGSNVADVLPHQSTSLAAALRAGGAGLPEIGVALTLLFAGGVAGKARPRRTRSSGLGYRPTISCEVKSC